MFHNGRLHGENEQKWLLQVTCPSKNYLFLPLIGRSSSRSGTEGGDSDSDSGGGIYRARTVTSTERVQIVQMPMELSQVSSEQLEMISLSPETEASREVKE